MNKNKRSSFSIGFISLGCEKNRVDFEKMIGLIKYAGYKIESNENLADVIIINTCSFIKIAREESVQNILISAQLKQKHLKKLIVTGCLTNMGYTDLEQSLPEVDKFVSLHDNDKIVGILDEILNINKAECPNITIPQFSRVISTPSHYAYLKISEGCDNFCSYCKIPYIRGRYRSYNIKDLIFEANNLAENGVKELILVGQDVTKYGADFKDGTTLVTLIKELSKIEKINKIRLLYCYPELITNDLIDEIRNNNKVCKYIDIPLQHVSNNILKLMNRKSRKEAIEDLFKNLFTKIPDIAIRTTFIIGFPGETEQDFAELCDFVKNNKLKNVGFFKYSREEGTPAYSFKNQVLEQTKSKRLKAISKIQYFNVLEQNKSLINKTLNNVIIDRFEGNFAIGRAEFQCPDVDGIIKIKRTPKIEIGKYYNVLITKSSEYDLEGEILWKTYQI